MFGKPEWFQRRKYSGWGLTPKTWQGWVYILVMLIPVALVQLAPLDARAKIIATFIWVAVIVIDVTHMMLLLKKDEREREHEAIAERNAAWAMVGVIGIGMAYQAWSSAAAGASAIDPFLIAALAGGLLAKMVSNIYLERTA